MTEAYGVRLVATFQLTCTSRSHRTLVGQFETVGQHSMSLPENRTHVLTLAQAPGAVWGSFLGGERMGSRRRSDAR